ncbi:MAG: shikimate dehydrogenase [Polyangiaceae bacterium]|nr:shikimate dehydrogenase [Polyangiaceae bacterium]
MTRREVVLLGHPVGHSVSPELHQAAFDALGLPHRYRLVDVPDEPALAARLAELTRGEPWGANVTVPWKRAALALAARRTTDAAHAGAANVLYRDGDELVAANTDVSALVGELGRAAATRDAALVIGSGGAALAAGLALVRLGFAAVRVTARAFDGARSEWRGAEGFERMGVEPLAWPGDGGRGLEALAPRLSVVVQATSAGMRGAGDGDALARRVPWGALPPTAVAYDVVYNPRVTPFLDQARRHGLVALDGVGMLVAQAVAAFELWFGATPPGEVMREAAERALAARGAR